MRSLSATVFRDRAELRAATLAQTRIIQTWSGGGPTCMQTNMRHITAVRASLHYVWRLMPLIIAQGVWATGFGRRWPMEARNSVYTSISNVKLFARWRVPFHKWLAYWSAIITHLAALIVFILCPPLFFLAILAAEVFLKHLPESDSAKNIGAWGPIVSSGLVILAVFITRYHQKFVDNFIHPALQSTIPILVEFMATMGTFWDRVRNPSHAFSCIP